MAIPNRHANFRRKLLTTSYNWPLVISILVLIFFGPTSVPVRTALLCDLLISGGGTLLCGLLLWFVALPRMRADPAAPNKTVEYQTAIAAPMTMLGALIAGLGVALYVLPKTRAATNAACAVFGLLILCVLGTIMVRAWRVFMPHPMNG